MSKQRPWGFARTWFSGVYTARVRTPFTFIALLALGLILPLVAGCASQRRADYQAALASSRPPEDFWLGVTVFKAPADTASRAAAYLKLPIPIRPARYVIEADRVLRAAVGSGATVETFPDQTRQLSEAEFDRLWETLRSSPLVSDDQPGLVGAPPGLGTLGDRTLYIVEFSAGGTRRMVAIEAAPTPGPGADDAKKIVEELAALAWMK